MARALALAACGQGAVEPNPMVGCVIVRDGEIIGEGFHERFGGPHAEIVALDSAGAKADGATLYVTLEPCAHQGKTPPCTEAIVRARIGRVVAAMQDPFPEVSGRGITALQAAAISCDVGLLGQQARELNRPYLELLASGRPWIIAKWATTLDGKLAARSGDSKWISSEASRAVVHQLRGRVDAIMIGSGTARADAPLLTARPPNPRDVKRWAMPIVVDSAASLDPASQLLRNRSGGSPLVAVAHDAPSSACGRLIEAGAEIYRCQGATHAERLSALLDELGRRRLTNVLVEGGSRLFGTLFDMRIVDEVHVFVAPIVAGGTAAATPVAGAGVERIADALRLGDITIEELEGDVYIHGRLRR
jgi:diaminohydroxyphosphoribosylaminopyrimidine deaminase / 5-amino-6-(5-phosphoribosylamino)uracil reductase